MQRILDFVGGKLTYDEFETLFTNDPSLCNATKNR